MDRMDCFLKSVHQQKEIKETGLPLQPASRLLFLFL